MTINVVCRKDAINRNHLAPLALVFTHDRRRKFVGLGISVALEHWDFEKQQPTTDCPDRAEIQFQITSKIREYEKKIKKLEVLEIPVTFDNLFEQNGKRINCTVGEYFKQIIERLEKVEKYGSASKHKVTLALMSQFRSVNMRFDELDLTYLREFEIFLRQRGNVNNSLATKFSVLKAVYNKAVSEGVFVPKSNPFQQFKVGSLWTNTRKRAITKEDIHKLIELDLSDRDFYTQLAKDIFLFSYFMAGINFKDIALLTYGDIDNGRIYYARRKTGKMMNCCLTEQAQEIIDKYHTDQVEEDYLFPILNRQIHTTEKQILERVKKTLKHVNKRLHELSEEIGLHTPLTTYVARHTYATVLKRSGVSVALILNRWDTPTYPRHRFTWIALRTAKSTRRCNTYCRNREVGGLDGIRPPFSFRPSYPRYCSSSSTTTCSRDFNPILRASMISVACAGVSFFKACSI